MKIIQVISLLIFLSPVACIASANHITVVGYECSSDVPVRQKIITSKSAILSTNDKSIRVYGVVDFRRSADDAKQHHCQVTYHLFFSSQGQAFIDLKKINQVIDEDESVGIDLIGFSPDGSKIAANFWGAEGDATFHGPFIYDIAAKKAYYRPLYDGIQKKIIQGCDQSEDFIGVTNLGEAVFAVPPSTYSDSPKCGDKGLWYFNLQTGMVKQVKKISGDKWE